MKATAQISMLKTQSLKICIALIWALQIGLWSSSHAQVSATLHADSNQILIGDYLNIRLTVKYADNLVVPFPIITDTLGGLELLDASGIDTSTETNVKVLSQLYTVSAYDSGQFYAGPVKVFFKNNLGEQDSALSNDILVTVSTLSVDTAKPFKAIKPPLEVPYSWDEFTYYYIALWFLIMLMVAGYFMWREQRKKKPYIYARPKPKDPAHIWAQKELKKLEEEKLWQSDQVKLYYSRLTDILRLYLEYRYNWLALESTTEEIQGEMEMYSLKEKAKENLLSILRTADLVKFAKMLPTPDANIRAMENAFKFIEFTEPKDDIAASKSQK